MILFFEWILRKLGLIQYRTRTVTKTKVITIKKPENDNKHYNNEMWNDIAEMHDAGMKDKEIGKKMGRTERAINQMRYRMRKADVPSDE